MCECVKGVDTRSPPRTQRSGLWNARNLCVRRVVRWLFRDDEDTLSASAPTTLERSESRTLSMDCFRSQDAISRAETEIINSNVFFSRPLAARFPSRQFLTPNISRNAMGIEAGGRRVRAKERTTFNSLETRAACEMISVGFRSLAQKLQCKTIRIARNSSADATRPLRLETMLE